MDAIETHAPAESAGGLAPDDARRQAGAVFAKLPLAGPVLWLYLHAPSHRHLFFADAEWLVLPPLVLGQSKVYLKDDAPLAYASWAWVSNEVEQRLLKGQTRLAPADWKSGDRLWLVDLVAPFGGADDILDDLRRHAFPGRPLRGLVPTADGTGLEVREWPALGESHA